MDDLINKVGFYFWVAVVGLVGGILSLTNNDALKSGKAVINLIVGTVSSMFVCWLAYEITFYFTEKDRFSLAVGGFFAWRGAVWMNAVIDKAIDKKIESFSSRDDDFSNLPKPPRDLNF